MAHRAQQDARFVGRVKSRSRRHCRRVSPRASASTACREIAAPAVFAERRADFFLAVQSDHQPQRLLDRLLLGRKAANALCFRQERFIDVDIGAYPSPIKIVESHAQGRAGVMPNASLDQTSSMRKFRPTACAARVSVPRVTDSFSGSRSRSS